MNIELKNMDLDPQNNSFNVIGDVYNNGAKIGTLTRYVHIAPEFLRSGSKREDFDYKMGKEVDQDVLCEGFEKTTMLMLAVNTLPSSLLFEEDLEEITRREFQAYLDRELEEAWGHAYGFDKDIEEDWV